MIFDPRNETVEKFIFKASRYNQARSLATGKIRSDVIAGFSISIRAIFETKANRAALRRLLG